LKNEKVFKKMAADVKVQKVRVIFIRHGFSCNNAMQAYGSLITQVKRLNSGDPPLTQYAINELKRFPKSITFRDGVDIVASSCLLRAIQTALYLFPKRKVHVWPFLKEIGWEPENNPQSKYAQLEQLEETQRHLVDYTAVSDPDKPGKIICDKESFAGFVKFLGSILHLLLTHKDYDYLKNRHQVTIAIACHSRFIRRYLSDERFTKNEKPRNLIAISHDFNYDNKHQKLTDAFIRPRLGSFMVDKHNRILFEGFTAPLKKIFKNQNGDENCKYKS
jgi:broad specificity phosphatase PhoE